MTAREEFCQELRKRLLANCGKVLLRVVTGPDFDTPLEFTGEQLLKRADELVSAISLPKERAVALLLLPHSPELFLLQIGLILKGQVPAILAWPTNRVDPEKYLRNLQHQLGHLPAGVLLTVPELAKHLVHLPYPVAEVAVTNASTAFGKISPADVIREPAAEQRGNSNPSTPGDDALFLQFSGGTTGAQKAIVVTAPMLLQQLERLGQTLQFTSEDRVASWLPLYHDMGLVACYWMALWYGAASTQIGANDWIMNPELLLKYASRFGATICWLPNFAFSYLAQRREFMRETHRLESVRAWINCSEPVRSKSLREFSQAFAGWGVRKESLQASYAMAETVFAITQTQPGTALPIVPRSGVKHGNRGYTELTFDLIDAVYVSSGRPLTGTEVKIVTDDGSPCPDMVAGEIYVHSPSLFAGYWGSEGFQTCTLRNGWHATGDYGFLAHGELFVIGRFKDIVIVGGNNIFPEDVEAVVNTIPGIYPGRVVAFGVDDEDYGTQALAVVAEMQNVYTDGAALQLEEAIRKLVLSAIGTAPRHVAVVASPWIVKSTAGKISRRETRERFLHEKLAAV